MEGNIYADQEICLRMHTYGWIQPGGVGEDNITGSPCWAEKDRLSIPVDEEFMAHKRAGVAAITAGWELCIGIELHAQISASTKLFSGAAATFGLGGVNECVALFDAAIPGTLPRLNEHCVFQAVKTGIALDGTVNETSVFERKHYFYPDMPQGFQITQQRLPIVSDAKVIVDVPKSRDNAKRFDLYERIVRISRIQLEQDSGKSVRDLDPHNTLIDLNRAGCALMEIVSEPDMRSSLEAAAYVKKIQNILRHVGTCDGNMEEGSLRCDVNISVRPQGEMGLVGHRAEIKNLNSLKGVTTAIDFEFERQVTLAKAGHSISEHETRSFDALKGTTSRARKKEGAADYRFMVEPDLPPLVVDAGHIARIAAEIPELPDAIRDRLELTFGFSRYEAAVLVDEPGAVEFFEEVLRIMDKSTCNKTAREAWNLLVNEVFGRLNAASIALNDEASNPLTPKHLASLLQMLGQGDISGKIGKKVLDVIFEEQAAEDPAQIVHSNDWFQITNRDAIQALCDKVLQDPAFAGNVASFIDGSKPKLFGFFVGQVMKVSKGKGNPQLINEILKDSLEKLKNRKR